MSVVVRSKAFERLAGMLLCWLPRAHAISQREGKNEHSPSRKGHVDRATEKKLASVQMPLAGRPDHTLFDSRPFVKPPIPGGHS